jgi:hypothetical protein
MTNGINHKERAHSMNCPGSVLLSQTIPEHDTESFYAREGTAAHELAEKCLTHDTDPDMYVGQKINGVLVTKEMASAVGIFVDRVRTMVEHSGAEPWIEVRGSLEELDLPVAPDGTPVDMFGTSDVALYDELRGKHLHIFDYKHGQGIVVEAEGNPQLLYYALTTVLNRKIKPRKITVWIIQPRAAHPLGIIREWTIEWEDLVAFKNELMEAAYATQQLDAPLCAGSWCRFCPASAICPEQHANAVATVGDAFAADMEEHPPELPEPETLDDETINRVLLAAPQIEDWFKSCRDYASKRCARANPVPGWKLVAKKSPRRWVDPEEAEVYLSGLGIDEDALFTKKILSPRQAEIALRREGLELAPSLITNESRGENLVVESDPRPAIAPVAEVFELDDPDAKA